jgi:hypothetical protein
LCCIGFHLGPTRQWERELRALKGKVDAKPLPRTLLPEQGVALARIFKAFIGEAEQVVIVFNSITANATESADFASSIGRALEQFGVKTHVSSGLHWAHDPRAQGIGVLVPSKIEGEQRERLSKLAQSLCAYFLTIGHRTGWQYMNLPTRNITIYVAENPPTDGAR